jgi:hypothetical protein
MMTDFPTFRSNILRFLEHCGVAGGMADEEAWEAAGCPPVTRAESVRFVTVSAPRVKPLAGSWGRTKRNACYYWLKWISQCRERA